MDDRDVASQTVIDASENGHLAESVVGRLLSSRMRLTTYWIQSPLPHAPLGFGVTAFSLDEALAIIRALDYGRYLGENTKALRITEGITVAQIDVAHVVSNMGPICVRGMWYPFIGLGVPAWAEERLRNAAM